MIKRKYVVLLTLTLVSIPLTALFYSNLVQAQSMVTGYVSVPASAFVPRYSTNSVRIDDSLWNYEDSGYVHFFGSVQLPHGSTVKNVTFYWFDGGDSVIYCNMYRNYPGIHQLMAANFSTGSGGEGSNYDDSIDYATVDNHQYAYFLYIEIPESPPTHDHYKFRYAVIEYELPSAGVGGYWIPVDKFGLLAPYIISAITVILAVSISIAYLKYRKKQ